MFDTDGDGLSDGIEVLQTNTNPRVQLNEDGDGFNGLKTVTIMISRINLMPKSYGMELMMIVMR